MRPVSRSSTRALLVGVAFALFALFIAYHLGLLHRALFRLATAMPVEWDISAHQTIRIYDPRWACGPGQLPYLLVETDDAGSAPLIGTHIRITRGGVRGVDFGENHFGECSGRFKNSLAMYIWEDKVMRLDGWCDDDEPVTGRFFDAGHCRPLESEPAQSMKIDELMKPYLDPE